MSRWKLLLGCSLLLCAMTGWAKRGAAAAAPPDAPVDDREKVIEIVLHDTLQPVSVEQFQRNLSAADKLRPTVIIVSLSSPGGNRASAEAIAGMIRGAATPVIVYLRQPYSHVSGEALRVLTAGTVAAANAETVLQLRNGGGAGGRREGDSADASALRAAIRANRSGRNAAVNEADPFWAGAAISGTEAAAAGLVDVVAPTEQLLLDRLDRRPLSDGKGGTLRLRLDDPVMEVRGMTYQQHLLRALLNPDLTVLLLTLGLLLIYLEINTPGSVLPGAAGVLLVMLACYGLLRMPVRWEAVLLLVGAAVLLAAEARLQRGALLGVFAVAFLVLGLRLLVRGPIPQMEVDWSTAVVAGIGFGGITAGLLLLGAKARRAKQRTGAEAVMGWLAVTQTALSPEGEVLVRGELWHARVSGESFLPAGECVKVQGVEGRVLEVAPLPASALN